LLSKAGVTVNDSPTATPSKTIRFFKVQKEILPDFLSAAPTGVLVSGVTVTRLLSDSSRNIVGAEVRTFDGHKKVARARLFVLGCGGIENPRLLLLSKSERFPEGIGNSSDMVGRGFNEHPNVNFYAKIPHRLGTITPTNKIGRTHQFYGEFRPEGLGSVLPVFRQAWILPHHVMPFRLSRLPRNVASGLSRLVKAPLFIGANLEMKIDPSNRVTLSRNHNDVFGNPIAHLVLNLSDEDHRLVRRTGDLIRGLFKKVGATGVYESEVAWSRHHQGTCRMGDNPGTSVVDRDLRVHDCPNLYVCGCDVFVTGGAMPPALTIVALAHRLADHLSMRLSEDAR
jgi:choline dehydrogenase-like flavoprotein